MANKKVIGNVVGVSNPKLDVYTKAEIDEQIYNIKVYKELFIAVYGETPVEDIFKAALAGMTIKLKVPNNREDCNTGVLIHDDYFYLDVAQAFLCGYKTYGEVTNTITFSGITYSDLGKPLLVTAECYAYTFRASVKYGWSYLGDTDIVTTNYTTYGVSIDLSNSNPETAVTYTDDAIGMEAGSSAWYEKAIFKDIRPCLFKDGAVVGYLNPNNFAQFEDGSDADITSGDAGDVMIEIPKIGYKISKIGTTLTVQITDDPNKDGFCYKAHTRTTAGDREKLYIGAFLGSNKDNKLRSVSGVSPLNATGLTDFRTYAKANGAGYDLFAFYPMTLLQCLYLIMYKNLDSQTALGMGYVGDENYKFGAKNTGATVDKGMSYGSTDSMQQMKFLGIEDFWGNLYQWIDGLVSSSTRNALVATDNFNDTGDGYTDIGQMCASNMYGYMKAPQGNNEAGFIISEKGGSASTYFSDYACFGGGCVPIFGGFFRDGAIAGAFRLYVNSGPGHAGGSIGGRLMYL